MDTSKTNKFRVYISRLTDDHYNPGVAFTSPTGNTVFIRAGKNHKMLADSMRQTYSKLCAACKWCLWVMLTRKEMQDILDLKNGGYVLEL